MFVIHGTQAAIEIVMDRLDDYMEKGVDFYIGSGNYVKVWGMLPSKVLEGLNIRIAWIEEIDGEEEE